MLAAAATLLLLASAAATAPAPAPAAPRSPAVPEETRRVLIVVSAATEIELSDGSRRPMGFWADEFARPYRALRAAGFTIDVATPGGAVPRPDAASLPRGVTADAFLDRFPVLRTPMPLDGIGPERAGGYAAVVIPGGYAPMVDLSASPAMAEILRAVHGAGGLVAAICHGHAALLSTRAEGRPWEWKGYRMAAFTNDEERGYLRGKTPRDPLEDRLKRAGVRWASGGPGRSVVVRDRNLLTGQNAASCPAFTEALLEALAAPRAGAAPAERN